MARAPKKTLSRLDQLKKLEKDITKNPELLESLIFNPDKVMRRVNYLDADLRANLGNINLFELLTGITGVLDQLGLESNCGPSSCGTGGTCTSTCTVANSCTDTCRTSTCEGGATIALYGENFLESLVQYSDRLLGVDPRIFKQYIR